MTDLRADPFFPLQIRSGKWSWFRKTTFLSRAHQMNFTQDAIISVNWDNEQHVSASIGCKVGYCIAKTWRDANKEASKGYFFCTANSCWRETAHSLHTAFNTWQEIQIANLLKLWRGQRRLWSVSIILNSTSKTWCCAAAVCCKNLNPSDLDRLKSPFAVHCWMVKLEILDWNHGVGNIVLQKAVQMCSP